MAIFNGLIFAPFESNTLEWALVPKSSDNVWARRPTNYTTVHPDRNAAVATYAGPGIPSNQGGETGPTPRSNHKNDCTY